LIWEPIGGKVQNARDLVISPDGILWLLPWAALPTHDGTRLLVENHALRLVISGGELLPVIESGLLGRPAALFANPRYDIEPSEVWSNLRSVLRERAPPENLRDIPIDVSVGRRLGKVNSLPFTEVEANQIKPSVAAYTNKEPLVYVKQFALENIAKQL